MTTSNAATTATENPTPGIRFALVHVFYAMSLLAAAETVKRDIDA